MGGRSMDHYHADLLDDFIGQNWTQFIRFIASREGVEESEAENLAEDVAQTLESFR